MERMFHVRRQERPLLESTIGNLVDIQEDSVALNLYILYSGWRWSEVEGEVRVCFSKFTFTSNLRPLVSVSVGI
jgi:hypothetical protein